jgi:hypothetical protein
VSCIRVRDSIGIAWAPGRASWVPPLLDETGREHMKPHRPLLGSCWADGADIDGRRIDPGSGVRRHRRRSKPDRGRPTDGPAAAEEDSSVGPGQGHLRRRRARWRIGVGRQGRAPAPMACKGGAGSRERQLPRRGDCAWVDLHGQGMHLRAALRQMPVRRTAGQGAPLLRDVAPLIPGPRSRRADPYCPPRTAPT